jgi:hypothetical protein
MADYKRMYKILFNNITSVMRALQEASRKRKKFIMQGTR